MSFTLPYGTADLDPVVDCDSGPPRLVRCFVRGCTRRLRTPTKYEDGDVCPDHGIRCHYSSSRSSPTYSYVEPRRNIIIARDLFGTRLLGHPFKHDTESFGLERSEDALTWNVFRYFQEAGRLHEVARLVTGAGGDEEPRLYLWGLSMTHNTLEPWPLLIEARRRFESALPVNRPLTEPDIALHLPGRYLILIEAKFTSSNTFYTDGPRISSQSLTKAELLHIYHDPELRILDHEKARAADCVFYQLWRNTVFAEWMTLKERGTLAFHASLTREGHERESCGHFRSMIRPGMADRFSHLTWEQLLSACAGERPELELLKRYFESKSAGLRRAFLPSRASKERAVIHGE